MQRSSGGTFHDCSVRAVWLTKHIHTPPLQLSDCLSVQPSDHSLATGASDQLAASAASLFYVTHTHTLRFAWRSVEDSVSVSGEHMSGLCAMSQYIPLPSVQCAHCTVVRQHHRFIDFSPSLSRSPEASHQCHSIRVLTSNQLCSSDSSMTHSACQCSLSCSTFLLRSSL